MKKLCLIALTLVAVSALTVRGAALSEGMHEFRFDVSQSFGNDNGYDTIPIFGSVGYFPIDNLEFGPYFSFRKTDWGSYWGAGSAWGLGLFAEYDMTSGSPLVPFFTARGGVTVERALPGLVATTRPRNWPVAPGSGSSSPRSSPSPRVSN